MFLNNINQHSGTQEINILQRIELEIPFSLIGIIR